MPTIRSSLNDMPPERLISLLGESSLLLDESVSFIQCDPVSGQFGKSHQLFTLHIQYAEASTQTRPNRLFLKLGKSSKEFFFYNTIARSMTTPPLLRCYYAAYDPGLDQTRLLFEDLSETHFQTEWPLPPSAHLCSQTVQELAKIHALWWQDPRLESEFRSVIPQGRAWVDRRRLAREKLPEFMDFLGDRLAPARRKVYEHLLASPAHLWEKENNAPQQTLLHGDMHFWNVFYPLDPDGSLYLFDWNMWDAGCPSDDLAYMMAVHWYPERRQWLEGELLKVYHRHLVNCGVTNYPWKDLQHDYRASVIRSLLIPAWQWVHGIDAGVWWSHLERVFLAFEDWKCDDLI